MIKRYEITLEDGVVVDAVTIEEKSYTHPITNETRRFDEKKVVEPSEALASLGMDIKTQDALDSEKDKTRNLGSRVKELRAKNNAKARKLKSIKESIGA